MPTFIVTTDGTAHIADGSAHPDSPSDGECGETFEPSDIDSVKSQSTYIEDVTIVEPADICYECEQAAREGAI